MKNLIQLTITFPESETQTMILEKGSEAYKQMIDYAQINEGVTSEKPHINIIDHSKNHYLCNFRCAGIVEIHTKETLLANYIDVDEKSYMHDFKPVSVKELLDRNLLELDCE